MNPLISVIVPVYNAEKYINKCLDSLTKQKYKNLEILLIDDGSTDESSKICDEYSMKDDRVKVIHQKNGGVSCARNKGLDICKGDYISFVDSDDYIESDTYDRIISLINQFKTDMIYYNYYEITDGLRKIGKSKYDNQRIDNRDEIIDSFLTGDILGAVWCWLIKKELINNIRFDEKISVGEDAKFIFDLLCNCNNIYFIKEPYYNYVFNNTSVMHKSENSLKNLGYSIDLYSIIINTLKKYGYYTKERDILAATKKFDNIIWHFDSYFILDKQYREAINMLLNNNIYSKILENVDTSKMYKFKKLFLFFSKHRCKIGLIIICFLKRVLLKLRVSDRGEEQ